MPNPDIIRSVSEVNNFIKTVIDNNVFLKHISVQGEISNLTRASSGHYYFSLKDSQSEIRCIMWKSTASRLKFKLEDGQNVKITGSVEVYAPKGTYNLQVNSIKPAGIGDLYQIYVKRLQDLKDKGYFDQEFKKELPETIKTVGVVTSETGAVIHDIITTIKRRNPGLNIVLVPSIVQGDGAAESIAEGIERLNQRDDIDAIIVGRGGGSLEDLWAFNEIEVADAIFKSKIPIVSSVGHETDITISDMVADLRAPTPTAAAEFVSYGYVEQKALLSSLLQTLINSIVNIYNAKVNSLNQLEFKLKQLNPKNIIINYQYKIDELDFKLNSIIEQILNKYRVKLDSLSIKLELLNPKFMLDRGFVMVTDKENQLVTSKEQAIQQKELLLHFYDGDVLTEIKDTNE